jgi:hypothetical protein
MQTSQEVSIWFGDRGVWIDPTCIVWHWKSGKLWFSVNQRDESDIDNTEEGCVDITFTHRENGSPIGCFELYDSIPVKMAPPELQEKLKLKKMKR